MTSISLVFEGSTPGNSFGYPKFERISTKPLCRSLAISQMAALHHCMIPDLGNLSSKSQLLPNTLLLHKTRPDVHVKCEAFPGSAKYIDIPTLLSCARVKRRATEPSGNVDKEYLCGIIAYRRIWDRSWGN